MVSPDHDGAAHVNFAKIDANCYAALHALCDASKGGHAGQGCRKCVGEHHAAELQAANCTPSDTHSRALARLVPKPLLNEDKNEYT